MARASISLFHTALLWSLAFGLSASCAERRDPNRAVEPLAQPAPTAEAVRAIAEEAYVYGFPMILTYAALYKCNVDKTSGMFKVGFNEIWNDSRTASPDDTAIVTPNADAHLSMAQLDLRAEPLVLCVPEVEAERYFSVMLADLYTCNYAYIGSRATGNAAGCYLVAGPDWQGEKPAGIAQVFRCETQFSMAFFRTQLFDAADLPNVQRIQAGYQLKPLSSFLNRPAPPPAPAVDFPPLEPGADLPAILDFQLQFCPSVPEEAEMRARMALIGIGSKQPRANSALSPELQAAAAQGMLSAIESIKASAAEIGTKINGWSFGPAFGNRAFYKSDWRLRASAALAGLYGNDAVEVTETFARHDVEGRVLDGSLHNYTLSFAKDQLPPVNSFWSLTIYDGNSQLLVENPLQRYLINSRMLANLQLAEDGSLTIYIKKDSPGEEHAANWLPAPDGPLYLALRLYWPKTPRPSILPPGKGTWIPPGIVRVD
jgi:hypothetical protein